MKALTLPNLKRADAGLLQDAWHYAMMIVDRGQSTFDGCKYANGVLGQVEAYQDLTAKIEQMADEEDDEWYIALHAWREPATFDQLVDNSHVLMAVVNERAMQLGIDARTGEKPE